MAAVFDNSWYADFYAQKQYDPDLFTDEVAEAITIHANQMLLASLVISEAIDGLAKAISGKETSNKTKGGA